MARHRWIATSCPPTGTAAPKRTPGNLPLAAILQRTAAGPQSPGAATQRPRCPLSAAVHALAAAGVRVRVGS